MGKIKRYLFNFIFFILMVLSSFVFIPLSIILLMLYILYFPLELIFYYKNKVTFNKVFDYSVFYSIVYKKSIKVIKSLKTSNFIYDKEIKVFIYNNVLIILKNGNKLEKCKINNEEVIKTIIKNKYNIDFEEIKYE